MDIGALCQCLRPHVTATTLRPLRGIVTALLVMTGRVTMLGISRWTGPGGSDRTVQRFFAQALPWAMLCWVFFRQHVYRAADVYLLVGDEVVATKAGTHTHGLDRFFSSLSGQPVPGLAFFLLSWVRLQQRRAFPLRVEQGVRSEAEQAASKAQAASQPQTSSTAKRRPGRPKGSKKPPTAQVPLTPEFVRITTRLDALLERSAGLLSLTSVGRDGHCGHHHALPMARQGHLPLIAKLRCEAALYFPSTGPYAGRGPHRKYGQKVDDDALPRSSLTETTVEGQMQTCISQMQLLHKEFPQPLHVVILVQTTLRTQARAHVVLFSRDLILAHAPLVDD